MTVTSQDGNVIHADFRKNTLTIDLKVDVLYADDQVCLARVTYLLGGKAGKPYHLMLEAE